MAHDRNSLKIILDPASSFENRPRWLPNGSSTIFFMDRNQSGLLSVRGGILAKAQSSSILYQNETRPILAMEFSTKIVLPHGLPCGIVPARRAEFQCARPYISAIHDRGRSVGAHCPMAFVPSACNPGCWQTLLKKARILVIINPGWQRIFSGPSDVVI